MVNDNIPARCYSFGGELLLCVADAGGFAVGAPVASDAAAVAIGFDYVAKYVAALGVGVAGGSHNVVVVVLALVDTPADGGSGDGDNTPDFLGLVGDLFEHHC